MVRRAIALTAALLCAIAAAVQAQEAGADPTPTTGARSSAQTMDTGLLAQRPPRPVTRPAVPLPAGRQPGRPGSFEVSGSVAWLGPTSLGSSTATLTSNGSSAPFTYFASAGRMGGTPAVDARVTYNLARRIAVEGGFAYSRPTVTFDISNDTENPVGTSGSERMQQYFADANVLVFVPSLAFAAGRGRAFVEAGGGYLRQLHAGNYQVETGSVFNGGGGIKYYFAPRRKGIVKSFGLRVDLRAYYKRGGFTFDNRNAWTASLGGGLIAAF